MSSWGGPSERSEGEEGEENHDQSQVKALTLLPGSELTFQA